MTEEPKVNPHQRGLGICDTSSPQSVQPVNSASALSFTVLGPPIPLARARVVKRQGGGIKAFTPQRSKDYQQMVRLLGVKARPTGWRQDGQYAVALRIYWPDARRRDASNVLKSVEDALNGVLWADDSQIVAIDVEAEVHHASPRITIVAHNLSI